MLFEEQIGELKQLTLVNEGQILAIYVTESHVYSILFHSAFSTHLFLRIYSRNFESERTV